MGSRRKARELALQALYRMDVNPCEPDTALRELDSRAGPETEEFALDLVKGTWKRLDEIDRLIRSASIKWDIARMAVVDRNVLRMATFELLDSEEIPARVVLNEAIEMAKSFGGEESGTFVNGVLDRIRYDLGREA